MTTIDALVRRAAEQRPTHPALVDAPNRPEFFGGEAVRLTWGELDRAVDSIAAALQRGGVTASTNSATDSPPQARST